MTEITLVISAIITTLEIDRKENYYDNRAIKYI